MLRVILASMALTSAAAAADDIQPIAADINVVEERTNAVAPMKVQNKGSTEVTLKNCEQSFVVAPGGHVDLNVNKASSFWAVPKGMSWDCNKGPFNLFYVVADFSGPKLFAGIGYGRGSTTDKVPKNDKDEAEENEDESDDESDLPEEEVETEQEDAEESHAASGSVAGVELVAVSASADGTRAIRCREDGCDVDQEVDLVPTSLMLNLIGADNSQLRGNHNQDYHGYEQYHHYHHHHQPVHHHHYHYQHHYPHGHW